MSATPFAMEQDQQDRDSRAGFDPASAPKSPAWYAGLTGYDEGSDYPKALNAIESDILSGVAKGQAVLGGVLHGSAGTDFSKATPGESIQDTINQHPADNAVSAFGNYLSADAAAKIKAFTPNAATTGAAAQMLHSVISGATEMMIGGAVGGIPGAALTVGASEGNERYNELIAAGVDPVTARKEAGITAVTAGLGAVIPGGIGESIAAKVASGAVGQASMGAVQRYSDHRILENAGYDAMADQQKVLDGTQVITDLVLGATFGGLAHLHDLPEVKEMQEAPGARDAALTTNLGLADRKAAPGIPADPAAANAHQDAMESSVQSLMTGNHPDVSDIGIENHNFVARDERPNAEMTAIARDVIHEGDLFGEDNARDVDAILADRRPTEPKEVRTAPEPEPETKDTAETSEAKPEPFGGKQAAPFEAKGKAGEGGEKEPGSYTQGDSARVLSERPDLTITDDEGKPVKAADALKAANDDLALRKSESKTAVEAAIGCYMRRGA